METKYISLGKCSHCNDSFIAPEDMSEGTYTCFKCGKQYSFKRILMLEFVYNMFSRKP